MLQHRLSLGCLALVPLLLSAVRADTVTGTVRNTAGAGVASVTIDLGTLSGVTNASGVFSIVAPAGTYEIKIRPTGTALAPQLLTGVIVAGTTNLGIIVLQPGFLLGGTVVNAASAPLAGADINVYDVVTGAKLYTPNDVTAANGTFSVVVPAGLFNVRAAPPAGVILVARLVTNVSVPATANVGTIALTPGVVVSGTVRNASTQQPIANVDIDVDDSVTGQRIQTPDDNTNALGQFSVIVPTGTFVFSFAPPPGVLAVAAQVPNVVIGGTTNVGIIPLQPGLALSGTVLGPGGIPVAGADIDVDTVLGGIRIYTPNDATTAQGTFAVVVPAGTYRVSIAPLAAQSLVGTAVSPVAVAAATSVGTLTLGAGVALSGTLLGWNGLPETGANIDVVNPVGGAVLVTPNDLSDAAGHWSVVVPNGTWNVNFRTKKASLSRDLGVAGVAVNGPTTLNRQLAPVPVGLYLASSLPNATAAPGTFVLADVVIWNPYPGAVPLDLDILLVDPAGVETSLYPTLSTTWPAQFLFFSLGLPIALPAVNPAYAGLPFKLRVRLREVPGGLEIDRDEFTFRIQ